MKKFAERIASAIILLSGSSALHAQPLPAVVVAPAQMQDLREVSAFTGRVVSLQRIDVIARVPGFLEEIGFTEGTMVEEGDMLFRIEDDTYASSVRQAEAAIMSAEAQLRLADIERARRRTLVERDATPQAELDIAIAAYDQAASNLASAEAQKADADLGLSYTRIEAPFSGMTGLSAPDVGALVGPESGPLTTLTSLDPISVEFPVAMSIYLEYREQADPSGSGDPDVTITLPGGKVYEHKGRMDFVSSTVDSGTDTLRVRAIFDNPDGTLLDSALVQVGLAQSDPQMVLSVPVTALQRDQQGFYVLVVDDESKVERRRVTVERSTEGFAVIADGLREGERVITEGQNKVQPGIEVDAAVTSEG